MDEKIRLLLAFLSKHTITLDDVQLNTETNQHEVFFLYGSNYHFVNEHIKDLNEIFAPMKSFEIHVDDETNRLLLKIIT